MLRYREGLSTSDECHLAPVLTSVKIRRDWCFISEFINYDLEVASSLDSWTLPSKCQKNFQPTQELHGCIS